MSSTQTSKQLLQSLTPELRQNVIEKTESVLLKIVRANLNTQYASKTPILAEFRNAISARGSTSDADILHDFRHFVPLSEYDVYKPFMAAFNASPCKGAELENLFAPGFPYTLAASSSTSGKEPKIFPKYSSRIPSKISNDVPLAAMFFLGYRELKYVEQDPGQIVKKIPVTTVSCGLVRAMLGWTDVDEDDDRMPIIVPGFVAPFAASMITHHTSFLLIHALFALAYRDTGRLMLVFSTVFYDLLRCVEEEWELLLTSIKTGLIPDLPRIREFRSHLQVNFHANPERAAELYGIGPPFSCEGWAARVWPKLKTIRFGSSGPFAAVLPKIKAVMGPTIAIHNLGYNSSESFVGIPYQLDDPHTFVPENKDLIEFLDVTAEKYHESLYQAWELEVGKQYEVVVTTGDGLWRYQLGDVIEVVGFDPNSGFPAFVLCGRSSLSIHLAPVLISDTDIMSAIQTIGPDVIQVNEFTTLLDDRQSPSTVGYLIELAGVPGPDAHLAPQRLSEGLAAANTKFQMALQDEKVRVPTIRILKTGTFAAFRQWKAEQLSVGPGQVKVPVVLLDDAARKWILECVVGELQVPRG